MNKLLYTVETVGRSTIAILETPCYPAIYYAGIVRGVHTKDPYPSCNDTDLWHRTAEEAIEHAHKMVERLRKWEDVKDCEVLRRA